MHDLIADEKSKEQLRLLRGDFSSHSARKSLLGAVALQQLNLPSQTSFPPQLHQKTSEQCKTDILRCVHNCHHGRFQPRIVAENGQPRLISLKNEGAPTAGGSASSQQNGAERGTTPGDTSFSAVGAEKHPPEFHKVGTANGQNAATSATSKPPDGGGENSMVVS